LIGSDLVRGLWARRLERGDPPSLAASALASAWAFLAASRVARPVPLPEGARVIGVGGAVLGGAGKTPVAIALVAALAELGHPVALIGHAYKARPGRPRSVSTNDPVHEVGDDALAAAKALASRAPVFVAPSRADAMDLAVRSRKTLLVVDGLLQSSPRPLDDAILVLDGQTPFGAGFCPPAGDLRAPRGSLLAVTNHVVVLGDPISPDLPASALPLSSTIAALADAFGQTLPLESITRKKVGLLLGVARPERLVYALARLGVSPSATVMLADHASFGAFSLRRARRLDVSAWLTTGRCATKLPAHLGGAPVLSLVHHVDVCPLLPRLRALLGSRSEAGLC